MYIYRQLQHKRENLEAAHILSIWPTCFGKDETCFWTKWKLKWVLQLLHDRAANRCNFNEMFDASQHHTWVGAPAPSFNRNHLDEVPGKGEKFQTTLQLKPRLIGVVLYRPKHVILLQVSLVSSSGKVTEFCLYCKHFSELTNSAVDHSYHLQSDCADDWWPKEIQRAWRFKYFTNNIDNYLAELCSTQIT